MNLNDLKKTSTFRAKTIVPIVGIGTTTASEKLDVNGSVKATSFITGSDRRLKQNIRPVAGWELLRKLQGVKYELRSNPGFDELGLIAQDVEAVFPEAVVTNKSTGLKGVKYQSLISPMIEAIKETHARCEANSQDLQTQVDSLNRELASVKKESQDMKAELEELKSAVQMLLREKAK